MEECCPSNTQAKVALHPLLGDIKDCIKGQAKSPVSLMSEEEWMIFTITVTPVEQPNKLKPNQVGS